MIRTNSNNSMISFIPSCVVRFQAVYFSHVS